MPNHPGLQIYAELQCKPENFPDAPDFPLFLWAKCRYASIAGNAFDGPDMPPILMIPRWQKCQNLKSFQFWKKDLQSPSEMGINGVIVFLVDKPTNDDQTPKKKLGQEMKSRPTIGQSNEAIAHEKLGTTNERMGKQKMEVWQKMLNEAPKKK